MQHISTPTADPESAAFWAAANEARFILRRCNACAKVHWFPRAVCPFCLSSSTEWVESAGRGTIYSYTVLRRAAEPYAVAYVQLEEGPRLLTGILADDLDSIHIGQNVEVTFVRSTGEQGTNIPMFRPLPETSAGTEEKHATER